MELPRKALVVAKAGAGWRTRDPFESRSLIYVDKLCVNIFSFFHLVVLVLVALVVVLVSLVVVLVVLVLLVVL